MTLKPKVSFFCMNWHLNKSSAFNKFLIDPLTDKLDPEIIGWDGNEDISVHGKTAVFCQYPPPTKQYFEGFFKQSIWIPMWDYSYSKSQSWWNKLPKDLKIIAYSNAISKKSRQAGLKTLDLKFYCDPQSIPLMKWNKYRTMLYWNRTGMASPDFLEKFSKELKIDKIIYLSETDPNLYIPMNYSLPSKLGSTNIEATDAFISSENYLRLLNQTNFFLAPRQREGVGLTFLEAMAQGSAVFACNSPTMNEYIQPYKTGVLLPIIDPRIAVWPYENLRRIARRLMKLLNFRIGNLKYYYSTHQNWTLLRSQNYNQIGINARNATIVGYKNWLNSIPKLAEFILEL